MHLRPCLSSAALRIPVLALALVALHVVASAAPVSAQAVNTVSPGQSDFVSTDGPHTHLELVRDEDARGPTDLAIVTSAGQLPCHLPCTVEVPSGMIQLLATGLDQRFQLELPSARFRVRAGEPVPWLESVGGMLGGVALGAVGTWVALNTDKGDEVAGGVALVALGVLLFGVSLAVLIIGLVEESGSVELDSFETVLREGVIRF